MTLTVFQRIGIWLAILAGFSVIFYYLKDVLQPFFIAALISYTVNPLVVRLVRYKVPRIVAILWVFFSLMAALFLLALLVVPLLEKQLYLFIQLLPQMMVKIQEALIPLIERYASINNTDPLNIMPLKSLLATHWQQAGSVVNVLWQTLAVSGQALFHGVVNFALIVLVSFYLLRDWEEVLEKILHLIPRTLAPTLVHLCRESHEVISAFFRGQLWVMLIVGLIYAVGLVFVGLNVGLLIGIMAGLLSIIPYLGFFGGLMIAVVVSLFQFHGFSAVPMIATVFLVGHALENFWLTPWLVGDKIGLHPVAVIFAILASGQLFGFLGVLLALPLAAILMVMLRFLYQLYIKSHFYLSSSE